MENKGDDTETTTQELNNGPDQVRDACWYLICALYK